VKPPEIIAKLDRIILYLTEQRAGELDQWTWETLNDAIWVVRGVRRTFGRQKRVRAK